MTRSLSLFAIGLLFGGGAGFLIAASSGATLDGHDHSDPAAHGHHGTSDAEAMSHDHGATIDLPAGADAPTLAIEVLKDPMSGWNLHLQTENFSFSPQNASRARVAGEGHAHVYVNGAKINRLYGDWYHLPSLPEGSAEISVSLNANDHSELSVAGTPLRASVTVTSDAP